MPFVPEQEHQQAAPCRTPRARRGGAADHQPEALVRDAARRRATRAARSRPCTRSNAAAGGAFVLDSGPLSRFVEKRRAWSYNERGWALAAASELQELSQATAASGETEGAGTDDAQGQHFITFVHIDGRLYELDGRTFGDDGVAFPVDHGATTGETFVSDAARVIREDFEAGPDFHQL